MATLSMLSTERKGFIAALDATPDDWVGRLAYADWFEENGDNDRAMYYRWTVKHEKCPQSPGNRSKAMWDWWWEKQPWTSSSPESISNTHKLDAEVYEGLSDRQVKGIWGDRAATREEIEDNLMHCLIDMNKIPER